MQVHVMSEIQNNKKVNFLLKLLSDCRFFIKVVVSLSCYQFVDFSRSITFSVNYLALVKVYLVVISPGMVGYIGTGLL